MSLRGFALSLALLCGSVALHAQVLPPCGAFGSGTTSDCTVGSSFSFDFAQLYGLDQFASDINGSGGADGIVFTYSFSATGDLPPGLTLSPSGLFSGTFTASGNFGFTLTITFTLKENGSVIFSGDLPLPLVLTVNGHSGDQVTVDPPGLNFNLTQHGTLSTKSVTLTNHGNQAAPFSASAATSSGNNWLKVSTTGGSVAAFGTSSLSITADPSQLPPGTYSGTVTVTFPGTQSPPPISVVAVVSGTDPNIGLSQTGLRFQAVAGGTATSPQTITVFNEGAGTLNFSASPSTISGGPWLSVSPSSGSSSASSDGSVTVSVNPAGLQPGDYYGKVQFSASGATNSPQFASVVLNVASPDKSPGAFVKPTGLIFVGSSGGTDPAAKTISVTNPSPNALSYLVSAFATSGTTNWLAETPTSGSVSSTQPATISVQPSLKGLATGAYIGDLTVTIVPATVTTTAPPQIFHIEVLLLVLPSGVTPAAQHELEPRVSTCPPSKLIPVFTLLGTGFTSTAGWPTAIEVTVVDDCGNPLIDGSVTVNFSTGDPALSLQSLNDGRWTSTWNASNASPTVTITAQAQQIAPALTGRAQIGGALDPNNSTPAVNTGGVVSSISFVPNQPLAPGSYAAIFGSNLSGSLAGSNKLPLSTQLGNTTAFLGTQALPLFYASSGQINAVLPYEVPANSTQQIVVQNGSAISIPQKVLIASAVPAIVSLDQTGQGSALYGAFRSDGTPLPNNSPVGAGDIVVIYCSGLGAVDPPVPAGSQAPLSPLSHTVNPVTVTFGQTPVSADFAGLAPTFAQLYQVNAVVPSGLPSGTATVTLSVAGQQSSPVTINIK